MDAYARSNNLHTVPLKHTMQVFNERRTYTYLALITSITRLGDFRRVI